MAGNMATTLPKTEVPATRRSGLTLMEIMVVIGIIVLVMALAVPALSVWESRKVQEAINLTSNLLKRAQAKAVSEHSPLGLFFYIEPETGSQYIWPIEPDVQIDPADPASPRLTADRFKLREVEPFKLPKPMRVVPASVLDDSLPVHLLWTPEQLADDNLRDPPDDSVFPQTPNNNVITGEDGTQYHRNFFVILFDRRGRLTTSRRAFIVDPDPPEPPDYPDSSVPSRDCGGFESYPGYLTRLIVNDDPSLTEGLRYVIVDDRDPPPKVGCGNPIRFQAAEALLIYNQEEFDNQTDQRRFLRISSQPLYIHPATGGIIKGRPEGA